MVCTSLSDASKPAITRITRSLRSVLDQVEDQSKGENTPGELIRDVISLLESPRGKANELPEPLKNLLVPSFRCLQAEVMSTFAFVLQRIHSTFLSLADAPEDSRIPALKRECLRTINQCLSSLFDPSVDRLPNGERIEQYRRWDKPSGYGNFRVLVLILKLLNERAAVKFLGRRGFELRDLCLEASAKQHDLDELAVIEEAIWMLRSELSDFAQGLMERLQSEGAQMPWAKSKNGAWAMPRRATNEMASGEPSNPERAVDTKLHQVESLAFTRILVQGTSMIKLTQEEAKLFRFLFKADSSHTFTTAALQREHFSNPSR